MKNFIQPGVTVTMIAPVEAVSGALIQVGDLIGVCAYSAPAGQEVEVQIEGVFDLAKVTGDAITQGAAVYVDTAGRVTAVAGTKLGLAVTAAGAGTAMVYVKLVPTVP